ncbi:L-threonylcarbamoyladenylate synthase [Mailhella sp.]|uniref:L-threonylcarbamoyladenylate synthase n=1 Tax=Mailhella sp. TaxID=1981029 RepID=UPI0040637596
MTPSHSGPCAIPEHMLCTALDDAARRLNAGGLFVYPTETFYGIGCRADRPEAVLRVFAAKRRAPDMPLPLILASADQLPLVAALDAPLEAAVQRLAAFWPAPLTLLLPVRDDLPAALTAGTGKVAVRVSAHPAARALAEACAFPVVSSSANISGRPAVTSAASLDPELLAFLGSGPAPDAVFDPRLAFPEAPPPSGGMASTIVEALPASGGAHVLRVLREGALPLSRLAEAGFIFQP